MRLLIIEANQLRIALFTELLPAPADRFAAKGRGLVYAGIMLDRDLYEQPAVESERWLSTNDFILVLVESICPDTPVLIHSMNMTKAASFVRRLENAGLWVTRIRMSSELAQDRFEQWLEEVSGNLVNGRTVMQLLLACHVPFFPSSPLEVENVCV